MTAAALLFLLAPAAARAASAPAADVSTAPAVVVTDPRVELLGVVQYLAGARPTLPADPDYAAAVEESFAPFRSHLAVRLYGEAFRGSQRMDGTGIDILYYLDPPELYRRPWPWKPPYLDAPGEAARWGSFLGALRDFALNSNFMDFYAAHGEDYGRVAAAAAKELGVADPVGAVSRYVGLPLDLRARWIVSPLFVPSHRNAYITPYPDPTTLKDPGAEPFEVTTLLAYVPGEGPAGDVVTQRHRVALWQEPLFVFIDPALRAFDAARGGDLADYYGADVARCRRNGTDCAKNWLVAALCMRLDTAAFGAPTMLPDGRDPRRDRYMLALAERLKEYENDRKKYPTLWDFLPRLMAVFPEMAGLNPGPAPVLPRAATIRDLFEGPPKPVTPE